MSDTELDSSDISSELEARNLVRGAADPRPSGDSVKQAIVRVARRLKWSFTRTRAIWYAEARRIDAAEMDALRAIAREQAARYSRLARALQAVDAEFYHSDIAALVSAARKLGGEE